MEYQARKLSSHEIWVSMEYQARKLSMKCVLGVCFRGMEYQARKSNSHEICVLGVWNTKPGNWVVMKYVC